MFHTKSSIFFMLFFIFISSCSANNCTNFESSRSNSSGFWTVVFVFNCFHNTPANPAFPDTFSSQATKYNEIDLSPNVYTSIPIDQLCPFRFLLSLDLSFNSIKSAVNAFRDLACLTNLESVNLANNQIASPVLASDFDDTFSSKLRSLNLTKNMIGYIQSRAFVKPDGSTRFPNLEYLGLAYNRLKDLDLLWPLTLPNMNLFIDIKFNNISLLTNEFNLTYNNQIFKYPMINDRRLDATTNSLQGFDDQNLLQYGLFDQQNLNEFLFKISNYDFRQANLVPTFICFCPSSGQLTLFWFRSISSSVDRSKPIFQLYCSNSPSIYVLDFPCGQTTQYTGVSTTTYSTIRTSSDANNPGFENLIAPPTTTTTLQNQTNPNQINTNYFYLFFLIIPIFLIFTLVFLCCLGRFLQVQTYHCCNLVCCHCFRSEEKSNSQMYDAIICYTEFDEQWAEKFLSYLNDKKDYDIALFEVMDDMSTKKFVKKLQNTLRIIVIVSPEFFEKEYVHKKFLNSLRLLKENKNVAVIVINKGTEQSRFNKLVKFIESPFTNDQSSKPSPTFLYKLKSIIKYNCGVKQVEKINFNDQNFWRDFLYIMPLRSSKQQKRINLPKIKSREFGHAKNKDFKLSYATDYKDTKKSRHVIIPIPEFMKTSLGFSRSKLSDSFNKEENDADVAEQHYHKIRTIHQDLKKNLHSAEKNSTRTKKNVDLKEEQVNYKKERSESADILAMFAPTTNMIFPLKNKRDEEDDEINS